MWYGVDLMAEKSYEYTPFVYTGNSPINFIDPDGQDWYEDECSGKMQWFEGSEKQDGFIHHGAEYQSGRNFYSTSSDGKSPLSFNDALPSVDVCADRICKESTSHSNSTLSDIWNGPIGRSKVPDKFGFSLSTSATVGVGSTNSLNVDWITRGNDASVIPYVTLTAGMQGGTKASADASFSFTTGYFFSSDLRSEPSGKVSGGLLGWRSAYGSGSIGLGGNVSLSGSGFGAGVGGGISGGLSQTIPLFDSQFRKK